MNNQRGIAMLMALMTMTVLSILVAELVYQTEVYHRVVFGQTDQLRAKYLAKSGLKLALLQLAAAKKAKEKIKGMDKSLGISGDLANKIWQTPIILPPPTPPGLGEAEKKSLESFSSSLEFNGRVAVTITGESQKLNLNQLVWIPQKSTEEKSKGTVDPKTGGTLVSGSTTPINREETLKTTREFYRDTIDKIIQNKKQENDVFREKYANLSADILIGNLVAWIDPSVPLDGENRNKEEYYNRLPNPYSPKNAPLSSMSELNMVRGFDDEIVNLLSDSFTTLLTNTINVNTMSATLLRSLVPELGPQEVDKIIERRNDPNKGSFSTADDFWNFVNTFGEFKAVRQELEKKGISFGTEDTAYRVVIDASSGFAHKVWLGYVGETPPEMKNPNASPTTQQPTQPTTTVDQGNKTPQTTNNDNKVPTIIYLKTE